MKMNWLKKQQPVAQPWAWKFWVMEMGRACCVSPAMKDDRNERLAPCGQTVLQHRRMNTLMEAACRRMSERAGKIVPARNARLVRAEGLTFHKDSNYTAGVLCVNQHRIALSAAVWLKCICRAGSFTQNVWSSVSIAIKDVKQPPYTVLGENEAKKLEYERVLVEGKQRTKFDIEMLRRSLEKKR